ncbi:MAG: sigma-70 family RNA polymerase sigma factor [Verrucomicrobiota bacterium]
MDTNQDMDSDGDRELLRRFADRGEEEAFGRLVDRHAAMVRGVALRCTGDAAQADEVAQSVFFLLARRAARVPADHLGGWLHRAAFLTARNARRNSLRYQQALRELGRSHDVMMDNAGSDPRSQGSPWEDVRPYLDEAVARLPERSRQPVMLRFFESRSIREIASLTGSSEAAVRKVLERALHRLSGLLRRRGIATNGAALGVMLSAQSLLAPPASAAALAAGALAASAAVTAAAGAAGSSLLLSGPLSFLVSSQRLKIAGLALLLATAPVAWLWRENSALRQDLRALRQGSPNAAVSSQVNPVAATPRPAPASGAAVAANEASAQPKGKSGAPGPGSTAAQLKEKSAREAAGELARIGLYLPGLTEDQRAAILKVYAARSLRRAEAFDQARQSGAFARLAGGVQNLTEEDKAVLKAMNPGPEERTPEDDPLKSILAKDQYARHLEAVERRKVNDAEGVASDALRTLGRSFDLSQEQKDAIFQAVAQFELTPPDTASGGPDPLPFVPGAREEQRDRVIRERLSAEQAALFDQRRGDDRQRREHFLQMMGGGPAGGQ